MTDETTTLEPERPECPRCGQTDLRVMGAGPLLFLVSDCGLAAQVTEEELAEYGFVKVEA